MVGCLQKLCTVDAEMVVNKSHGMEISTETMSEVEHHGSGRGNHNHGGVRVALSESLKLALGMATFAVIMCPSGLLR